MNYWIIPWNKEHYDLPGALAAFGFVDWHQWNNFEVGDIVYIYCTLPTGRLCYELNVERVNIPLNEIEDDSRFYIKKDGWTPEPPKGYVRLRLMAPINTLHDKLTYSKLVQNGMAKCVRTPIKVKAQLLKYINSNLD